jgi:molecular chaperone HscB
VIDNQIKIDCFSVFGLKRSYCVDAEALSSSYIKQQSESHPDRFYNADDKSKAESLKKAAELNHAYSILNSDEMRARHLLELEGFNISGEDAILQDPEILEEAFEIREKLASAETIEEIRELKSNSVEDMRIYAEDFNRYYQNKEFEESSFAYKKMLYKKKFIKEINLKYRELEG